MFFIYEILIWVPDSGNRILIELVITFSWFDCTHWCSWYKNAIDTNKQAIEDLGLKLDNDGCIKECVGVEDNWQQYGNSGGYVEGIKYYINCNFSQNILKPFVLIIWSMKFWISVNFGDCGSIDQQMTEVISVNTWMTCDGGCFMAVGSNSLYNLTNESFRVFLNQLEWYIDPSIKAGRNFVQFAKEANYQLHYEIKGRCK